MTRLPLVLLAVVALAGCASVTPETSHTTSGSTAPSPIASATPTTNVWAAPGSVKPDALPLGDGHVSTTSAAVGSVFACRAGNPNAGGAQVNGPWIHGSTWNATQKVVVQGDVTWPTANFTVSVNGGRRVIVTNDLPSGDETGNFPIRSSDPAFRYDRNPNAIDAGQSITVTLPTAPAAASTPGCLPGGAIGVLLNGVLLFDALDGPGRDAVAHEEQDLCQGHPQQDGQYHYHEVPSCLRDHATAASTVVGWALDGYPIVVERDAAGNLPTDADLDACHGRTSAVTIDGALVSSYHYDATLEYPYTLGCFHGAQAASVGGRP